MSKTDENFLLYSESVLEFIKSAQSFCVLVRDTVSFKRSELVEKLQQMLPVLYSKALKLPDVESVSDEGNEKFVNEEEYMTIQNNLKRKFGYLDDYLEVDPGMESDEGTMVSNLSEKLTDIYQDLQDFLMLYQLGSDEMMNDAIWECRVNFGQYWGSKLLSVLQVLHQALNAVEPIDDEENEMTPRETEKDTSDMNPEL